MGSRAKPWFKSGTIQAAVVAALYGIIGYGSGEVSLNEAVTLVLGAVMAWRLRTGQGTDIS